MPPKNRITRKIKGSEFEGEENLSAAEWSKLVVDNLTNSAASLDRGPSCHPWHDPLKRQLEGKQP